MRFKAFISYKHSRTSRFAEVFELHLKKYAKALFERPDRLFRDEQYLKPGDNLPDVIRDSLIASEFLILLASPEAAESVWVKDELTTWCKELGRKSKLIVVLTAGKIEIDSKSKAINWSSTNALPALLEEYLPDLPLFVDLSWMQESTDANLANNIYRRAINAIAARLRDIPPNDLDGKEWKIRRRNIIAAWTVSVILLILLVSVVFSLVQIQNRNRDLKDALQVSRSRELTTRSQLERIPASLMTAAEAVNTNENSQSVTQLYADVAAYPTLQWHILKLPESVSSLIFDTISGRFYTISKNSVISWKDGRRLPDMSLAGGDDIMTMVVAANGDILVSTDDALWNLTAHKKICGFVIGLSAMAVGMDKNELIGGASDGKVYSIDLVSGSKKKLYSHDGAATGIVISDQRIISGALSSKNSLLVFDRDRNAFVRMKDPPISVDAVELSLNGKKLAVASEDGSLTVYDLPGLEVDWKAGGAASAGAVSFSPTGGLLAAGSRGGEITVLNADNSLYDAWNSGHDVVTKLLWKGDTLISGGSDGWITAWIPGQIGEKNERYHSCTELFWSDTCLMGVEDSVLWDLGANRMVALLPKNLDASLLYSTFKYICFRDSISVMIYDPVKNEKISFPAYKPGFKIESAVISDDGKKVVCAWWPVKMGGVSTGALSVWDVERHEVKWVAVYPAFPKLLALCGDSLLICAGSQDLIVQDIKHDRLLGHGSNNGISWSAVAFLDEHSLLTGDSKGILRLSQIAKPDHAIAANGDFPGLISTIRVTGDKRIIGVNETGMRWFDDSLKFRGIMLESRGERPLVHECQPSPENERLAVRLQSGRVVVIPLCVADWIKQAKLKGSVLVK